MNKTKKALIVLCAFILLFIISELVSDNSKIVRIGVLTPLTGNEANIGREQKNAISLAISDIKEKGNSFDNYMVIYEDSGIDERSIKRAYDALKSRNVVAIIADGDLILNSIREKAAKDKI